MRNKIIQTELKNIKNCQVSRIYEIIKIPRKIRPSNASREFPFDISLSLSSQGDDSFERRVLVNNFSMQGRDANVVTLENSIFVRTSSHLLHNRIGNRIGPRNQAPSLDAFKTFLKARAQPTMLLRYIHDKIPR